MDEDSIVSDADYQTLNFSSEGLHWLLIISFSLFSFLISFFLLYFLNFYWKILSGSFFLSKN